MYHFELSRIALEGDRCNITWCIVCVRGVVRECRENYHLKNHSYRYDLLAHLDIRVSKSGLTIGRRDDVFRVTFRLFTLCVAAALIMLTRLKFLGGFVPEFSEADNPGAYNPSSLTRALTLNYYNFRNMWVMIYPKILCCDWAMGSIPVVETLDDSRNIGTIVMHIVLISILIRCALTQSQSSRSAFIGFVMLIVPYIPSTNLFVVVGFVTAERTLYVPSLGFCVVFVVVLDKMISMFISSVSLRRRAMYITTCIVCAYVARTIERNGDWMHEETLWRSGIEVNPLNSKLHGNLGSILMRTWCCVRVWCSRISIENNSHPLSYPSLAITPLECYANSNTNDRYESI